MHEEKDRIYTFDSFQVDPARRRLWREGRPVQIHSKTFDLLLVLIENTGRLLEKDELLQLVWPNQVVEEGNLTVKMSTLRKILGDRKEEARFIVTIPGRGYRFVADVKQEPTVESLVIERHAVTHIVVEEERETTSELTGQHLSHVDPIPSQKSLPASATASRPFLSARVAVVAVSLFVLIGLSVFGYRFYQNRNRQLSLAGAWVSANSTIDIRQLTANGKVIFAALSPDGNYFSYVLGEADKRSLWFSHVNGNQRVELRPADSSEYYGLTFSLDGNELYYVATTPASYPLGVLLRIPVMGGAPQQIVNNIKCPVAISPDGKSIAFVRNDANRKLSVLLSANVLDGSDEKVIATRPLAEAFAVQGASWSPDGELIAVGGYREGFVANDEIVIVNVRTGHTETLGTKKWSGVRRVTWLKDGTGLLVNVMENEDFDDRLIWLLEYPTGEAHKVTRDLFRYAAASLSVSDDGKKVLAVRSESVANIWSSPATDFTQAKAITSNSIGKNDGALGLAVTPDGQIVYSSRFDKSETLWVMNFDGDKVRQLTTPGFLDRWPSVTRDGRYVVFQSTRSGAWNLWRVRLDGSDLRQITTAGGDQPNPTPDGQWVLYHRDEKVWKVSIDGAQTAPLVSHRTGWPAVSPDGKFFACGYRPKTRESRRLAVFSINGGEPLQVFNAVSGTTFENGIRWLPDGTGIVYNDFGPTLWKQLLVDGPPQKIIERPAQTIFAFDWSAKQERFAMAVGASSRDVVLITTKR
jgi:DNA-binding winged helix-turn-helix (wHTH) protein/Tol biopolymer transport system component